MSQSACVDVLRRDAATIRIFSTLQLSSLGARRLRPIMGAPPTTGGTGLQSRSDLKVVYVCPPASRIPCAWRRQALCPRIHGGRCVEGFGPPASFRSPVLEPRIVRHPRIPAQVASGARRSRPIMGAPPTTGGTGLQSRSDLKVVYACLPALSIPFAWRRQAFCPRIYGGRCVGGLGPPAFCMITAGIGATHRPPPSRSAPVAPARLPLQVSLRALEQGT